MISCMIDRQRGDDGRVLVTWVIYQIEATGTRTYATADFTDYTGQVLFQAGERSKVGLIVRTPGKIGCKSN